jgi:tripartite-type tricarboxylate transporter receptor subunit TctC
MQALPKPGAFAMRRRTVLAVPLLALPGLAAPHVSRAQASWPNRPVRVINPYPPGGTSDIVMRLVAGPLERAFGQPFVIEPRPGAGGSVGTAFVATQPADGHTLLVSNTGPLAIAETLFPNLPYKPATAFTYIAMFGGAPILCAVGARSPFRTLADYTAAAKARPEDISFGSSGVGSVGHLAGVMYSLAAGVQLLHVPFRGASEAETSVLSGATTSLWNTLGAHAGNVQAGQLRALAVTSPERLAAFPDIPTVREQGLPDVVATNWFLLAAPAGLSPDIATRINRVVRETLAEKPVAERLASLGMAPLGDYTPEALAAFVAREGQVWAPVVRASGAS